MFPQQQRYRGGAPPNGGGGGGGGMGQQQQGVVMTRLPEINELRVTMVRGVQTFTRRYRYVTGFYLFGICILGILILTGGHVGRNMDDGQVRQYHQLMDQIDIEAEYKAEAAEWTTRQRYQASRSWWFGMCRDRTCQRYREQWQKAQHQYRSLQAKSVQQVRQAKAVAGVTSDMAVTEMQNSFWSYFTAGKKSAQRRTVWDVMWMILRNAMGNGRGRDEGTLEFIVKVLLQLLLNFTIGLVMALIMFVFSLWSIVNSYQPNPIVAVLIFLAAVAAGFAFVTTYLLAMAGATFGSVYGVAKLAEASARQQRLGAGQQQYQRPRVGHYD